MNEPEPPMDHRLDLQRRQRLGMVEAVWGEHKSADQITAVMLGLHQAGELALVTRVSAEKAAEVQRQLAEHMGTHGTVPPPQHHPLARCLTWPAPPPTDPAFGRVAVLSGGEKTMTANTPHCKNSG